MDLLEQELIGALREGNENAFEMLFKTYYQSLCSYAWTFLHDKDEAEEVVQATYLAVWDKRHSIEIQTSTKSYLYRMVRNACLNVIKHESVKRTHIEHERVFSESSHDAVAQSVTSSELEQKIYEAMKALPEQCRLVFQLSRFEDLKYAEIARQLNISVKTVENHMGKALKIMRERLKEYLPIVIFLLSDLIQ